LGVTELIFEKIIAKKTEIFEDRIDLADHMKDLLIVTALESLIDIKVDIPCEVVEVFGVLIDQLLVCLQQQILAFLLLLQQIHNHDALELTPDVLEVLEERQCCQLLVAR
jgi:hypothetical protein